MLIPLLRRRVPLGVAYVVVLSAIVNVVGVIGTTSPAGAACALVPNPSGTSIPTTVYPGGKTIFTDDFNRCDLGSSYGSYNGHPGGNPNSTWSPSMVSVSGSALHLSSSKSSGSWVTGGVSNYPVTSLYGRWDVRMRVSASTDTSYHVLLWPRNEIWPPEIDFGESIVPDRTSVTSTLHYKDAAGTGRQVQQSTTADMKQWHTLSVEWRPEKLVAMIDDVPFATITDQAIIPKTPMWLAIQVEGGACARRAAWGFPLCPSPYPTTPTTLDVDWIRVTGPA